jgi:hypothetical protein
MSTEVLDLQAELQRDLANMGNTIVKPTGQKIKITAGRWALPNGKTSIEPLSVIILGWRWINRYYPGVFDAADIKSPECWAVGEEPDNLAPNGGEDQQHTDCASCPQNKFGSSGKGKACRNGARIAMVAADLKSDIVYFDVAPTTIKSFSETISKLTSNKTHPLQAIVEVDIDTKVSYAKANFTLMGLHDLDLNQVFALKKEAGEVLDSITFDFNG